MREALHIAINGILCDVVPGTTVAAALLRGGTPMRRSVSGELRSALCGMGVCFECRATVNGVSHQRTCQILCEDGMAVETGP